MRVLGIEIKHPSTGELVLAAFIVAVVAGVEALLYSQGIVSEQTVWPTLAAVSTGVILTAFGVSLTSHGWRAAVVMVAVGAIVYLLVVQ